MIGALPYALRQARTIAFATPLALLGGALISQYVFGLIPCDLCVQQRWPHVAALLLAGAAFALRDTAAVRWLVVIAAGGLATSAVIGGYHAGVEYGWWLGPNCGSGSGGALAEILAQPIVACDKVQWSLFGVSLAGFNFLFSLAASAVVTWLTLARRSTLMTRMVPA